LSGPAQAYSGPEMDQNSARKHALGFFVRSIRKPNNF